MRQKTKVEPTQDLTTARCLAKTKKGFLCQHFPKKNGRCRLHGGLSTGPRTLEGLERSKRANWKHGFSSLQFKQEQQAMREAMKAILKPQELAELSPEELQAHLEALNNL